MAVNSATAASVPLITGAIQQAAKSTGVSFEYLLTTAQIESNLNPAAQAPTSTAKGLYQFIEQTWLGTMKEQGGTFGFGRYADAIVRLPDGRFDVADAGLRAAIMKLRSDPTASAMMAGAFARSNAAQLRSSIGRAPSEGELYIAHFLGPDGAGRLIAAAATQPTAKAATMFPQAAAANPGIFYDKSSRPRSASEVYAALTGRFDFARATSIVPIRGTLPAHTPEPAPPPVQAVAAVDPAEVARTYAATRDERIVDTRPLFQAMFTDGLRPSQTADATPAPTQASISASPQPPSVRGFRLFADQPADTARLFNGKF
jgi:hypothetical protein